MSIGIAFPADEDPTMATTASVAAAPAVAEDHHQREDSPLREYLVSELRLFMTFSLGGAGTS